MTKKKMGTLEFIGFWVVNVVGIAYCVSPLDFASYTGLDDAFVGFYVFNRIKDRYFK